MLEFAGYLIRALVIPFNTLLEMISIYPPSVLAINFPIQIAPFIKGMRAVQTDGTAVNE